MSRRTTSGLTRSDEGADEPEGAESELSHVDAAGRARMVDVTGKPWTRRRAVARCQVRVGPAAPAAELLETARLAGIQAAKQTSKLIPLCHPLTPSDIQVRLSVVGNCLEVEGRAEVVGPTGVEMEALTACAVAALTVTAELLPLVPETSIEELTLWEKSGGRSGAWRRA